MPPSPVAHREPHFLDVLQPEGRAPPMIYEVFSTRYRMIFEGAGATLRG
jgi:hypothetical protein